MTTKNPAQDVSDLNTLIDKIRATEYPQDIDGGPEEYGFRRGIDLAVAMLKRHAAKKELPDYSQPATDMHGNLPGMWEHSDTTGGQTDARELQQAQVVGENFDDWFGSVNPYVNALADDNDEDSCAYRAFAREAWCAALNRTSTPQSSAPVVGDGW